MEKQLQEENSASEKIRELEIKITYLENHVEAQDRAMLEQSRQIETIVRELRKIQNTLPDDGAMPGNEKPPHY